MKRFTVAIREGVEGFLFAPGSADAVVDAVRSEGARAALPYPVFLRTAGKDASNWFASRGPPRYKDPDAGGVSEMVYVVTATRVTAFSHFKRFSACTQLIKVMGCANCEKPREECFSEGGAPAELTPGSVRPVDDWASVDFISAAKKTAPVWGVYAYTEPHLTRTGSFQATVRSVREHVFSEQSIAETAEALSEAASKAAETRRIVRVDCPRCLFGQKSNKGGYRPGCNRAPRHCSGPYADETAQQDAILATWDPRVAEFMDTGEFTKGQFWAIAASAGIHAKFKRRSARLGGWEWTHQKGFRVAAYHDLTWVGSAAVPNASYGEVRNVFDALPSVTSLTPVPPPMSRAIWYLALEEHNVRMRNGWGHALRSIMHRTVNPRVVSVGIAADRYMYRRDLELRTLYEAYTTFEAKPPITLPTDQK